MSYKSSSEYEDECERPREYEHIVKLECGHEVRFRGHCPKVGDHLTCNKCLFEGFVMSRTWRKIKPKENNHAN